MYTKITTCLACGNEHLVPVLDLGNQPLANSYTPEKQQDLPEYELKINRCTECYHVQLSVAVDPELMFKDYLYVSGTSKTMLDHFAWFARFSKEYLISTVGGVEFRKSIKVLDIGCNDGSQLDAFKSIGCETIGIDPAENLYATSSANHNVSCGYFNEEYVAQYTDRLPKIITAQNVFAHNYDPVAFMTNVERIMECDSLFFVQTSQANMILNNEFDTIYHEHISFYNIKSMKMLCKRSGLNLIDVIKAPLHGTSYIFVISKTIKRDNHIDNLIAMEDLAGLYSESTYEEYRNKCISLTRNLEKEIESKKSLGYTIIGYGAAAKGNTLLNFSKIRMDYIIDDNPLKHNQYTPGSAIEIVSVNILNNYNETDKILFVPLAWNFFKEIKSNILKKRDNPNDKFLTYFPTVEYR